MHLDLVDGLPFSLDGVDSDLVGVRDHPLDDGLEKGAHGWDGRGRNQAAAATAAAALVSFLMKLATVSEGFAPTPSQ